MKPLEQPLSVNPSAPVSVSLFRPTLADGGADRVTITLLRQLDRRRFSPTLILNKKTGPLIDEVPPDVPIIELGAKRLALALPQLTRALKQQDPDVLFCTAGGANAIVAAAHFAAGSRARLVLSERNAIVRPNLGRLRVALEVPLKAALYRRADCVTAVSQGVADDLTRTLRLPTHQVAVVYNPVVSESSTALAQAPVDHPWCNNEEPLIVAVGRLVPVKDYPTMLSALVRVRQHVPARLLVLGQGAEMTALKNQVTAMKLDHAVQFLGFDKNPYRYMARAAFLWQSSRAEGLPGTLVQAMSVGTPVIATDCDFGPREVVTNGVDGFLVPVGDSEALAEHGVTLLTNPKMRATFSAAAREHAKRFSVPASIARYEAALLGTPLPTL